MRSASLCCSGPAFHDRMAPGALMRPSQNIGRLLEIMAALRDPKTGCAWDCVQTHASLAPYALEEAYEVVDAIERRSSGDLRDELGDLLLQVAFHSRVAEEAGTFSFGDVVEAITAKMLRRHPHVFEEAGVAFAGSERGTSSDGIDARWDAIKASERKANSDHARGLLADVPIGFPALTRAVKLQRRASSVGFDWGDVRLVLAKIREEIDEIEQELETGRGEAVGGEVGDLLFAVANLARHIGVDPETVTRATNSKFERRFAFIEAELAQQGSSPEAATLDEMDQLWNAAKRKGL